ncbi:hypothetical protein BGX27_005424 [Mortierella sp. AM989]|nr:hypothetical protein BGX27_005424 [Mortierella sp. AM989]
MGNFRPFCAASNGERFYVASLQSLSDNSGSSEVTPTLGAFSRRIVLLQSQSYSTPHEATNWTVVDSFPSFTSNASTNDLDILVGDFANGTSNCQVDAKGNFVWISAKSASKNSSDISSTQITSRTSGIRYTVGAGSGGIWSLIKTSRLPGLQGIDYIWNDEGRVNVLFTIAQGVFVHATASSIAPDITLGVLTDNNLVQSNKTWSLDAATYGIPKAIAYSNNTIYLLGSNKVLSLLPVNTSALDAASLDSYQQALTPASIGKFPLTTFPDDCLNSQLSTLYSTAVGHNVYFLCTGVSSPTNIRFFWFDGIVLRGPYQAPILSGKTSISTFAATSGSLTTSTVNHLFMSIQDSAFEMTMTTDGLRPDAVSYVISNSTTSSPPITSDSEGQSNTTPGGIVGGLIATVCVLALLYCRSVRQKRNKAKIERIIREHDGLDTVSPEQPMWAPPPDIAMPLPPPPVSPDFRLMISEEQHDQAQIELQRLQLGPTPLIVASASPLAPPSTVSISEDASVPSSSPLTTTTTVAAVTPEIPIYQHHSYQHDSSSTQQLHQGRTPDDDSYSQQMYCNTYSESSTNDLIPKAPMQTEYHELPSGSQSNHPYNQPSSSSTPHPSSSRKEMSWAGDESENPISPPPPPPPPYVAKATQLLNSPSAPLSNSHHGHSNSNVYF